MVPVSRMLVLSPHEPSPFTTAIVAVAHSILVVARHILGDGVEFGRLLMPASSHLTERPCRAPNGPALTAASFAPSLMTNTWVSG